MFYHSEKKKIRGWKRHKRKIERWKEDAMNLDIDYLREYHRDYIKLWIHPFYVLVRRNPPVWYNKILLEAMIDVYLAWYEKMKNENEDFYLKIWLYDPHFINSQIVVAYKDCIDFYNETFEKRKEHKKFPYDKFCSLKNKLKQFEWELHIDTDYYDENDLNERIMDGFSTEKEVQAIKDKAYKIRRISNENETDLQYCIDKGDVWIGTLKN